MSSIISLDIISVSIGWRINLFMMCDYGNLGLIYWSIDKRWCVSSLINPPSRSFNFSTTSFKTSISITSSSSLLNRFRSKHFNSVYIYPFKIRWKLNFSKLIRLWSPIIGFYGKSASLYISSLIEVVFMRSVKPRRWPSLLFSFIIYSFETFKAFMINLK